MLPLYNSTFLLFVLVLNFMLNHVALAAGEWYDLFNDNTVCRFMECCNSHYVPYDVDQLESLLLKNLFGQPLVHEVVNILGAHKETVYNENKKSKKALVISFHGWAAVGKTYAVTMIAKALYKEGMDSKFVKLFMGKKDFDCTNLEQSKKMLINTVNAIVRKCPTSLIIFDEIHDMCPYVLDAIKPMLDHHHAVDGVDYRDSIFIFITNIGGNQISSKLLELYSEGLTRNDVQFHQFEPILRKSSFFSGGLENSKAIAHHLIDHYIPFLPLEHQHVERCALVEFRARGVNEPSKEMMLDALTVITYGPEDQPIFANNGCRRFSRHIPYIIQKHKPKTEL